MSPSVDRVDGLAALKLRLRNQLGDGGSPSAWISDIIRVNITSRVVDTTNPGIPVHSAQGTELNLSITGRVDHMQIAPTVATLHLIRVWVEDRSIHSG